MKRKYLKHEKSTKEIIQSIYNKKKKRKKAAQWKEIEFSSLYFIHTFPLYFTRFTFLFIWSLFLLLYIKYIYFYHSHTISRLRKNDRDVGLFILRFKKMNEWCENEHKILIPDWMTRQVPFFIACLCGVLNSILIFFGDKFSGRI